jgi:hypothetical protein
MNEVLCRIGKNPNFRRLGINVVSRKVSSQNRSQIEFVQLLLIGNKALTEVFIGEIYIYSVGGIYSFHLVKIQRRIYFLLEGREEIGSFKIE